jgi:hypothetical protein
LVVLAAVAGVLYAAPGDAGRPALSAQVVGLQVTAQVPGEDMMARPFNQDAGVALAVLLRSADKTIVAFDSDASRLALLQDDKGTDLKGGNAESMRSTFGFPQLAKDGKSVLIELRGEVMPAAGAARIKAEGTAVLKVGSGLETVRQENVALKADSKITVGPVPLTIKDVQAMGGAMQLTISADQELDAINGIQFQGAGGAEIKAQDVGWSTTSLMGKVSAQRQIRFDSKVDSATVVIKYWKSLETQQVPLKLEAGLSLQ